MLVQKPKAARHGDGKAVAAKPAKLAESKSRKRGGAAAAPRAKRAAGKAEVATTDAKPEKKATKRGARKSAKTDE
jgi:hypothetical protein